MLRQAVKSFLQRHNRLTYSSLQGIIRRIQTFNINGPQLRNGSLERVFSHSASSRYVHSTAVCYRDENYLKHKRRNKDAEGKTEDCDQSIEEIEYKHDHEEVALHGKEVNWVDERKTFANKNKLDLTNFLDKLDENDDSNDNYDDRFDDYGDDEALGKDLEPFKGNEIKILKKNRDKSLVTSDMYFKPKSITQSLLEEELEAADIVSSETNSELAKLEEEYNLNLAEKGELKVQGVTKVEIPALTDVGPIVNDSEILKKLVELGVDLSVVQKKGMIEHVLKMNLKKDVGPYIWLLKDIGVPAEKLGEVFTKCPWIFQHDVRNIRVRIDYLRSKKFTRSDIENMIDKDPKFLLIPVEKIDAKLGFLQHEFKLTGKQVREKVGGLSKLIIAKPVVIKESKFYMKQFLGFTENELKTIFLTHPKVFLKSVARASNSFDYLHNVMGLPHDLIAKFPKAMDTSRYILENRHRFLVKCGRAQYDPTKPNYVSLHTLLATKEDVWCVEVAKASVVEYNQFLRLI